MAKKDLTTYVALDIPQATPEDFERELSSPEWEEGGDENTQQQEEAQQ